MVEARAHEQCVKIICAGPTTENKIKGLKIISNDYFLLLYE